VQTRDMINLVSALNPETATNQSIINSEAVS